VPFTPDPVLVPWFPVKELEMSRFDNIINGIPNAESLPKLLASDIDALRSHYPELPEAYLDFLQEVGYGKLGEIQLYSAPTNAQSIYSPLPEHLQRILLIGDDMQGYCFGFDMDDGFCLVEVSPKGMIESGIEPDFISLLNGYFD
jgi:hypothetical protein